MICILFECCVRRLTQCVDPTTSYRPAPARIPLSGTVRCGKLILSEYSYEAEPIGPVDDDRAALCRGLPVSNRRFGTLHTPFTR
jgi:hypothetical protein